MKEVKLIDVVNALTKKGYKIQYYVRKDGGIVIQRINGKVFKAKTGNAYARELLGVKLSERRATQLGKIRTPKGVRVKKQIKIPLDKAIANAQRRVNRKRAKYNVTGGGIATRRKIEYSIRTKGKEATLEALLEQERYTEGLAYSKNVDHIISRLEEAYKITKDKNYKEMIKIIKSKASTLPEKAIQPIYYNVLDALDEGVIDTAEALNKLKMILE